TSTVSRVSRTASRASSRIAGWSCPGAALPGSTSLGRRFATSWPGSSWRSTSRRASMSGCSGCGPGRRPCAWRRSASFASEGSAASTSSARGGPVSLPETVCDFCSVLAPRYLYGDYGACEMCAALIDCRDDDALQHRILNFKAQPPDVTAYVRELV